MKKEISLVLVNFLDSVVVGTAWIGFGISGFFDNKMSSIIGAILLLTASAAIFFSIFAKTQGSDEMSRFHLIKARAATLKIFLLIILFVYLVIYILKALSIPFSLSLLEFVPFILGIINILSGALFIKYERNGD